MKIKGWIKNSFIDYPGTIATTIFTGGCNFKCPFCHNGDLVLNHNDLPLIPIPSILEFLSKRKGLIDGICISGGEATLQEKELYSFLSLIKQRDIKIKLDTNGYKSECIKTFLTEKLVDYIAMDIKNTPSKYAKTIGLEVINLSEIQRSINLIQSSALSYEFRTTVIKEFHTEKDLLEIGSWLKGSKKYCLQQYHKSDKQIHKEAFHSYDLETLKKIGNKLRPLFSFFEIRGINN